MLVGLGAAIALAGGVLPSGTQTSALIARAVSGLIVASILVMLVRRMARALGSSPPGPPQTVDARTADVVYECPVCGTRVRLELAATAKAPRHCGEEMEAKISSS